MKTSLKLLAKKSRIVVSFCSLLLLFNLLGLLADAQQLERRNINIYSAFGQETAARSRAVPRYTGPRMRAATLRGSARLFRVAGGVMFDAIAQPCQRLKGRAISLRYDPSQPDGRRLIMHSGDSSYVIPGVYDKEIRPIADFAQDQRPVVVNLLEKYPGEERKTNCRRPQGLLVVTLHPAFENTEMGWLLARADMLPSSFMGGRQWHTGNSIPQSTAPLADLLRAEYKADNKQYFRSFVNGGVPFNDLDERHTKMPIHSGWGSA